MPQSDQAAADEERRLRICFVGVVLAAMTLLVLLSGPLASAARAATVSGTVSAQATSAPIAEASVYVATPTGQEVARATTALDGSYRMVVPPGTYNITVSAPGAAGYYPSVFRGTSLTEGQVFNVSLTPLGSPLTIGGVLRLPDGTPVEGMGISLGSSAGATTASDGSFSMVVEPGEYRVLMRGNVPVPGGEPGQTVSVELTGFLKVTGNMQEQFTLPAHTVSFHVEDATGNPIAGAQVGVLRSHTSSPYYTALEPSPVTSSGPSRAL